MHCKYIYMCVCVTTVEYQVDNIHIEPGFSTLFYPSVFSLDCVHFDSTAMWARFRKCAHLFMYRVCVA